ncbi:hypothetical protein [Micromonospora carbonacea]|uniref:hypothetical protein n=1 Tax=Micromonospora carbonacea TaxID=47853 RepID=UPI0037193610
MEIPVARAKDPRARTYIIDHLRPGTTIHRRVEVHNDSPKRQHIEIYPAGATIEKNTFTALPDRTGNELSSWVSTEVASVDLPPRARERVKVTIRVPDTASAGERYAAVLAEVAQPPTDGGNIGQIRRVGVRIYLNIGPGGEPPTDFRIGEMTVSSGPGRWPIVTAPVHNTGQRALDMTGHLSLSRESGTAEAGPFKITTGVTILPGQTGHVSAEVTEPMAPGRWKAHLVLTSGVVQRTAEGAITLPGPIEASVPEPAGNGQLALSIAAGAALAAVLAALLIHRYRRRTRPPRSNVTT